MIGKKAIGTIQVQFNRCVGPNSSFDFLQRLVVGFDEFPYFEENNI